MFFLWSTATSSSSEDEEMWGWRPTRRPCSLTSGRYVTQLPDDLDHSTSQALAARLHPEGRGGRKAIRLIHAKECSCFVIKVQTDQICFRRRQPRGCPFSHFEKRKISHKNPPHPSNITSLLESLQYFRVFSFAALGFTQVQSFKIHLIFASKTGSTSADGCFGFGVFGLSVVHENTLLKTTAFL